jgi:hypothetical protein
MLTLYMASNPSHEQLFVALKRLRTGWPSRGWSWDSRMTCITSTFTTEFETKARAAIAEAMPNEWMSNAVAKAPAFLREYVDRYGGLRPGQVLFSSGALGGSLVAFGLWWPWGDQNTVSVRVGFADVDPGRESYQRLREIFGVQL